MRLLLFFLNILWEWKETNYFKMPLILHCTNIRFPKAGFTVNHSALAFHVRCKAKYFSISMLVWPSTIVMVPWFVLPTIFIIKCLWQQINVSFITRFFFTITVTFVLTVGYLYISLLWINFFVRMALENTNTWRLLSKWQI